MTPESIALVDEQVDLQSSARAEARSHVAGLLRESDLSRSDLVLAMARGHRRHAVELAPRRLRSTFTIREFARLSKGLASSDVVDQLAGLSDPGERLRRAIAAVSAMRSEVEPPVDPADDDVVDPYRGSIDTYRATSLQLVPALAEVARIINLVVVPPNR